MVTKAAFISKYSLSADTQAQLEDFGLLTLERDFIHEGNSLLKLYMLRQSVLTLKTSIQVYDGIRYYMI